MRLTSILQLLLLCFSGSWLVLAEIIPIDLEESVLAQYGSSNTALEVDVGDVLQFLCTASGVAIFRMTSESEFLACAGTEENVRLLGTCVGIPGQAITESIRHIPENVASNLDYSPETTYFFAGFAENGLNTTHPSGPPCSNGLKMAMRILPLPTDPPPTIYTQNEISKSVTLSRVTVPTQKATEGLNVGGNGDGAAGLPFPAFVIYILASVGGIIVIGGIICPIIFILWCLKKKNNKGASLTVEDGPTSSGTHYTDPKPDKKDSKKSKTGLPTGGGTPPAAHQAKGSVKQPPKKESKKDLTKKDSTKKLGPANKGNPTSQPGPSKTRTKAPVAPSARVEADSSSPPIDKARASINKNNVSFHKNGSAPTTTTTVTVAPNRSEPIGAKKQAGSKVSPKDPLVTISVTPNSSVPTSSAVSGSSRLRDRAATEHSDSPKNPAKKSSAGTRGAPSNKLGANGNNMGGGGGAGRNYGQRAPAPKHPPAPVSATRSLTITDRPPVSRQHQRYQPVSSSLIPTGAGKR